MTLLQYLENCLRKWIVKRADKRLMGAQWHLYLVKTNQNTIEGCFNIACCEFQLATIHLRNLITEYADTPELAGFARQWREIDTHPLLAERVPDVHDWDKFLIERGEMRALLDIWESEHHAP